MIIYYIDFDVHRLAFLDGRRPGFLHPLISLLIYTRIHSREVDRLARRAESRAKNVPALISVQTVGATRGPLPVLAGGLGLVFITALVTNPHDESTQLTVISVFTSHEAIDTSGLPADIPCITPLPHDLARICRPDQWVVLDPTLDEATCMPIATLIEVWDKAKETLALRTVR